MPYILPSGMNTGKPRKIRGITYRNDAFRKLKWCWERVIDGKRVRTFFATQAAAARAKAAADTESRKGADSRRLFDAKAQREYDTARRILAGKISFVDCALWFREHENLWDERKITVAEAMPAVIDAMNEKGVSKSFRNSTKVYLRKFSQAFASRQIASIRGKEVAEWILGLGARPITLKTIRSKIAYFFARCVSLELMKTAPKIPSDLFPKEVFSPVAVYTTQDTEAILRALLAGSRRECLATFALLIFCGLRRTEADRMRWEWVDENRRRIVVPAAICKTRDDWVLQSQALPQTVWNWLAIVPAETKNGRFPQISKRTLHSVLNSAGVGYRRNGFRHTFCTMHISLVDSAEKTALLLRHRGTQMLYRHYLAKLVPKEEAEKYFALTPQKLLTENAP